MDDLIDSTYLPFSKETVAEYLACANGQYRPEGNLLATGYYQKSAAKYQLFSRVPESAKVFSLALLRDPRQIEKDERIWTAAALITLDQYGDRWQVSSHPGPEKPGGAYWATNCVFNSKCQ
jgi:hypothetical protein